MGFEMRGQAIEHVFDPVFVRKIAGLSAELCEKIPALRIVIEEAMYIRAGDPPSGDMVPSFRSSAKMSKGRAQSGPSVWPIYISKPEKGTRLAEWPERSGQFFRRHHGLDIEQAESRHGIWHAFDASRIGDAAPNI